MCLGILIGLQKQRGAAIIYSVEKKIQRVSDKVSGFKALMTSSVK